MRKQYKPRKTQKYGVPNTNNDYRRAVTGMKTPKLTRTEKSILTAIVHRNDADGYCFPSERDIAETAPAHVRTVQRAVPKLIRLKLLRKTSRTKTGKRNGSCGYAATVSIGEPTRHHVEGTRHLAVPEHGTVSGLNKPIDQTIEQSGDPIRLVGDKLLEILKPVIVLPNSPWMISTAPVCKRLFNACRPEDFEEKLTHTLNQARQLRYEYLKAGKTLTSWTPLLKRMASELADSVPGAASEPVAPKDLPPLVEELRQFMPAKERGSVKVDAELQRLSVCETEHGLVFSSRSRLTVDTLRVVAGDAFGLLAKVYGLTVQLKHDDLVVQRFEPQ